MAVHGLVGVLVVVLYLTLEAPFAIAREGRIITLATWARAFEGSVSFQFLTNYLIYFALVGVGHALNGAAELREREVQASRLEAQLAEARLRSLRAQLQPHFLFNTLHTIGGLVREGDADRAVRMLTGLSGLLRHTLDRVESPRIPLHEELEALERYLEIEEVRFEDRLQVQRHIDPTVTDALVPALLLQPLVENAVRHGIEDRIGTGRIRIEARREVDGLVLQVSDDGRGLPADFDLERDAGVGLGSTRRRLDEWYGSGASLRAEHRAPHGTRITVSIPWEDSIHG